MVCAWGGDGSDQLKLGEDENLSFSTLFSPHRLPVILQAEAAECALACLAMVSTFHGQAYSLTELRRKFSTSLKGTNLRSLMDMADALGLSSRPLRLEMGGLRSLKCPVILHWDLKHFVVLRKVTGKRAWIHDPARGRRTLSLDEVSRSFTGVAVEFTTTPAFEIKKTTERARLMDFFSRVRGLTPSLVQLFALATVLELFGIFLPMLNQLIVDDVVGRGDLDLLLTVAIGMGGLLLVMTATSTLSGFINLYMGTQLNFQMQSNLLRHVFRLPVSWFEKRNIGDIISRFDSLRPLQTVFSSTVTDSILALLTGAVSLAMMFIYTPLLTAIEIATVFFFFAVRAATFPYFKEKTVQGLHLGARVQSTFLETLRGARTFKAFGRERERIALWQNEQAAAINNNVQVSRFSLWGGAGNGLLGGVQRILVWYIGTKMVINGQMTLGMLFAYQAYTLQFTGAAGTLVGQFFTFRTLRIHLERLTDVTHAEVERNIDEPIDHSREFSGAVAVRDLSFRYGEHDPWIVQNASFSIEPGECVCFTGPSGGGKTTLMKLLLGFYDPQEGEVMVDNFPLRSFGTRTFRGAVGVVMQDDKLFSGTIADNIAFFDPEIDMAKVKSVAAAAQVHKDIMKLPMNYMSLVGDMGSTLSGGQRQRIFLARALYRDPKVLFLDEGTANLDRENEDRILRALKNLKLTRIVVAHREAIILDADRVFSVVDRKVSEMIGPRVTLAVANS
jgi:ATP-binding cassette, subfamily B, bacterial CvaB/MchF/RaxB